LNSPTSSFFFASTEITGLCASLKALDGGVDVLELGVAIRVRGSFLRLAIALQTETCPR